MKCLLDWSASNKWINGRQQVLSNKHLIYIETRSYGLCKSQSVQVEESTYELSGQFKKKFLDINLSAV